MCACNSIRVGLQHGSWRNRPDGRFAQARCPICSRRNVDPASISAGTRYGGSSARLKAAGYVTRRRMRKADGQWRWQIEFTDTPPTTPTHPGTIDGSGVDVLHTLNHSRLDQCEPHTTAAHQRDKAIGADQRDQLRYPDCLRGMPVDRLWGLLAGCPGDLRQAELDEVDAMHNIGKVRDPIGLLSVLARKAGLGQFAPNHSIRVDRLPPVAERRGEDQRTQRPASLAVEPTAVSELGRRVLSDLRKRLSQEVPTGDTTRIIQEGGGVMKERRG